MWTLTEHKNWKDLEASFGWVRDMNGVPQDPVHHAEGDVAIHTRMVLAALEGLEPFRLLDPQARELLWAAALLHDVEKRSTTLIDADGRITSPGHARKGAFTARQLLYVQDPAPFHIREAIAGLVRYHGLPLWAMEKSDPAKAVIEASLLVSMPMLSLLARADAIGRSCADQSELLYRIDLFDELCRDQECWEGPRAFASPNARFTYFQREAEAYPDYVPFDDFGSEVILLSGLPGAGKDTHVFHHYRDWPVINLDAIRREMKVLPTDRTGNGRVIQEAKERARVLLRKGDRFVWNATNITRSMREQLIGLFTTYKAFVRIVYVEVPFAQLQAQNSGREAVVPFAALDRLVARLDVPSPTEAHTVEYIVNS